VPLRVIRDGLAPAAWNMAVDEALLHAATTPTLRLYGWRPHAVSLGWFQRHADFADVPPGIDVVRRLTGGGAICHGDELTFSLALDADALPRDVAASYALLHDAAVVALRRVGVASRRLVGGHAAAARPRERWCFAEPGDGDLVTDAGKLLGSAQRRVRAPRPRVLHHGSLPLQRPALTPFVAAVADARDATAGLRDELGDELVAAIAAALRLEPVLGALDAAERAMATDLAHARYGDPAFTRTR
jgi:lipoate-protein ligase A